MDESFKITESQNGFLSSDFYKSKKISKLFLDYNWELTEDKATNIITGCTISGALLNSFISDKHEEIMEDLREKYFDVFEQQFAKMDLTELLESHGYTEITDQEIEDPEGNIITGECCNWLKQTIQAQYKYHCRKEFCKANK